MRRFIVEVMLDVVLLLFIILLLGMISVGQPFPFGPTSAPIAAPGRRLIGFLTGPPSSSSSIVRAAGARGPDRAPAVLDDGLLRRDHQRDRDLDHVVLRADQDRRTSRSPRSYG